MSTLKQRIEVKEFKDETHIEVYPSILSWQLSAFLVWNIAWTFCGIIILIELFSADVARDFKLVLFTYLAFWGFFEWKGLYYFLWKKLGKERIRIYADGLQYKRDINVYGKVITYDKENIHKFFKIEVDTKSFGYSYSQSFWMPGNETIGFEYLGKTVGFGLQLKEDEQQTLIKAIKHHFNRVSK